MARCTAPVQGHRTASGRAACPACGGGYRGYGSYSYPSYSPPRNSGGGQSSLVSWSLDITAVPEPVTMALGIFASVFLVVIVVRSRPVRNRVQHWRVAAVEWINAV